MSGEITVTSTTDSQQAVDEAASHGAELIEREEPAAAREPSEEKPHGSEEVQEQLHHLQAQRGPSRPSVASSTDSEVDVQKVQDELDQEREDKRQEYLDPKNRNMKRTLRRMGRLVERNHRLEERLAQYEPNGQPAQPQNGDSRPPQQTAQPQQPPNTDAQMQQLLDAHKRGLEQWAEGAKAASETHADYAESVARLDREFPVSQLVQMHLVVNTDNGPDIGYFLSKHPEAVSRLWALEAAGRGADVISELNGISTMLRYGGGGTAQREPRSTAPRPVRALTGASTANVSSRPPDQMDFRDYRRWRENGGGKR